MSDRGSTPSNPPSGTLADQGVGATQVIDLADIDLSGALPEEKRPEEKRPLPPPLPPEEIARASQAPPGMAPVRTPSLAPQPAGRSTSFYVVVLAGCLVAFLAVGALIARSMRGASPGPAASASGRVITISPVEMTDDVDASTK